MEIREWLASSLQMCGLDEEAKGYVFGRGATEEVIAKWGIKTFEEPPEPCPDITLHKYYGKYFERFIGKLIFPLYSPRGALLGFDSRTPYHKDEDRFLLKESKWNPVWIGMPYAMDAIWRGSDIIIVEGRFDVWALSHVLTQGQAILGSGPAHLSYKQIEFLERWAKGDVYMVYDNDDAGRKGTQDAIMNLRKRGVSCSNLPYGSSGEDPGDIWDRKGVPGLQENFPHL